MFLGSFWGNVFSRFRGMKHFFFFFHFWSHPVLSYPGSYANTSDLFAVVYSAVLPSSNGSQYSIVFPFDIHPQPQVLAPCSSPYRRWGLNCTPPCLHSPTFCGSVKLAHGVPLHLGLHLLVPGLLWSSLFDGLYDYQFPRRFPPCNDKSCRPG